MTRSDFKRPRQYYKGRTMDESITVSMTSEMREALERMALGHGKTSVAFIRELIKKAESDWEPGKNILHDDTISFD